MNFWASVARSCSRQRLNSTTFSRQFTFTPHTSYPRLPWSRNRATAATTERSFAEEFKKPSILRPTLFAVGLSGGVFCLAAYETQLETKKWSERMGADAWWRAGRPTSEEMQRAERIELGQRLSRGLADLQQRLEFLPMSAKVFLTRIYILAGEKWLNLYEGRRTAVLITGVNALVFLAWQFRRLQPFMSRNFMHNPLSGLSFTLLTSVFSHRSFAHIFFNSVALMSFGTTAHTCLRIQERRSESQLPASTTQYHMLGFYISAGLFSGLLSHIVATRFKLPRMIAALSSTTPAAAAASVSTVATPTILPSLGASGAVYAAVTLTALTFPHSDVSIILLPMVTMPIGVGVGGLVALDIIGIIRGWRMFDHWAHLGGALFGGLYYLHGAQFWDWIRVRFLQLSKPTKSPTH